MRAHSERFGMPSPKRLIATGGASANKNILKVMANVFGCDVYTVQQPDSASLGAALRAAAHGWVCNKKGSCILISLMYEDKLEQSALGCKLAAPAIDKELLSKYTSLIKKRVEIEDRLVREFGRV